MVRLRKIFHKGNDQIGIYFGFDEELKIKAKSIGARWSQGIPLVCNEGLVVNRL